MKIREFSIAATGCMIASAVICIFAFGHASPSPASVAPDVGIGCWTVTRLPCEACPPPALNRYCHQDLGGIYRSCTEYDDLACGTSGQCKFVQVTSGPCQ